MSVIVSYREDRSKWQVCYYVDGKRKRRQFKEKPAADNFARKIRIGMSPDELDSIPLIEAGRKYFASESQRKNPKSRANDKRYINLHFHFMNYERGIENLASVSLEDMEAFRDWLPTLMFEPWQNENPKTKALLPHKPMSMGPKTVNRCLAVIKHMYKKCIHWKHIETTPCEYLEFLEAEDNDRPAMTGPEYLQALRHAPAWFSPTLQFIYLTGAAASSVARLTWNDIDFDTRTFSLLRKKGRKAKWKRIPQAMTDPLFALLIMVRNEWPNAQTAVFRDEAGLPLAADTITKFGNIVIKASGVKDRTLYCLRHGLASDLTEANVATEIVRQVMGHASITTTQRYANKGGLRAVAGAIAKVRGGKVVAEIENDPRIQEGAI